MIVYRGDAVGVDRQPVMRRVLDRGRLAGSITRAPHSAVRVNAISELAKDEALRRAETGASWRHFCWKKAHATAWKTPPREIALARLKRAEELGMSYREYTAHLLDTGEHL
jgi:hypothetical protein